MLDARFSYSSFQHLYSIGYPESGIDHQEICESKSYMKKMSILLITLTILCILQSRPVHADQVPTVVEIYEEHGIQKEVDIQLPPGYENIKSESKGKVYFLDEDKEESVIADIRVVNIPKDGIAHAQITGQSASILIKKGHFVKFLPPPQVAGIVAPSGSISINNGSADEPITTINKIYEENGVQKEMDVSLPSESRAGIKIGSKGSVYTKDEDDNTESLIADIEVTGITSEGLAHAKKTKGSDTIKIKIGDVVKFSESRITDTIAPAGDIKVNNNFEYTNSRRVTLSLSAADNRGVTSYYISPNPTTPSAGASGWQPVASSINYSENVSYTLDSGDGNKTVYMWYKDGLGNISNTYCDSIVLDTAPPSISITRPYSGSYYPTESKIVTLGGDASDTISGICEVIWSDGTNKYKANITSHGWSAAIELKSKICTITVMAFDCAGNMSKDEIRIDSALYIWYKAADSVTYEDKRK